MSPYLRSLTKDYKMEIVAVIILGLFANWVMLMLIPVLFIGVSILLIKQLSDDPKRPNKPYFFTAVEPGRIKAVMRGGKVRRYLMNFAEHSFPINHNSRLDVSKDGSWEVIQRNPPKEKYEKFDREAFFFWFRPKYFFKVFDWCLGVIYDKTGHKFTGIWPFQVLHIYRFNRKVQKLDDQGHPMTNSQGLPLLVDSLEMTDHVRARTFVRQSSGQEVETKEGLKVKVTWVGDVRVKNPQKALFGTDRWDITLDSVTIRELASKTRTMPINEVLTIEDENKRDTLSKAVLEEVNKKLDQFGLAFVTFNILDFEGNLSEEEQKALTAKWRAEREKEAARITGEGRGQGRAAEITLVAQAVQEGGEAAQRAQELEAKIAMAKAAEVAIIGGQSTTDGTSAAILAELRKLNKRK